MCQLEETYSGSVLLAAQQQRPLRSRPLGKGWAAKAKGTPGGQVRGARRGSWAGWVCLAAASSIARTGAARRQHQDPLRRSEPGCGALPPRA